MCCIWECRGQFTDINLANVITVAGTEGINGNGISLYDFNKDGLDDITFCTNGAGVHTFINNGFFFDEVIYFNTIEGDIKQATWVDFDNDLDPDFFCTIFGESCRLFRNDDNLVFTDITDSLHLPASSGYSFGAAWGDYDNDGFLDVYVANYDFILPLATSNWLFHNNGSGAFVEVASALGVDNSFKATFQPTWVDINDDQLLDLFVINDKYHGNNLYLNNGNTFNDISQEYDLAHAMEAMSNSWTDFDNDLDLDVYISNTTQGNKLMRNDGNYFTDVAPEAGVELNSVCWNALWMDYDNNGWEDLHVSTNADFIDNNQNHLFRNNEDGTFYDSNIQGDNGSVLSTAKGDFNADGFWDFAELRQYPLGIGLYQNYGGNNHWLKISLEGVISNRDGVAVKLKYYWNNKVSIRSTFCGEGFLSQDSQYEILGLDDTEVVDSLIVQWPSGWVDKYFNVQADQFLMLREGETFDAHIANFSGQNLCSGDTIFLSVNPAQSILWMNGSSVEILEVTAPGWYSVLLENEWNLFATDSIEILEYALPDIEIIVTNPLCADSSSGSIQLLMPLDEINSIEWNSISGQSLIEQLHAGEYTYTLTDINGCVQSGSYTLIDPPQLNVTVNADTACFGEPAFFDFAISGGTGNYITDWMDPIPDSLFAGAYSIAVMDENNCINIGELTVFEFPQIIFSYAQDTVCYNGTVSLEYEVSGGTPDYTIDWAGENPGELGGGFYEFIVVDQRECSTHVLVEVEASPEIILSSDIVNAINGENGSAIVNVSGGWPPYTYLWNNESTSNPLEGAGQGIYTVLVNDAANCAATLEVEIFDTHMNEMNNRLGVYPNPCIHSFTAEGIAGSNLSVYDAFGRVVYKTKITGQQVIVDSTGWSSGIYFISQNERRSVILKIE